MNVFHGIVNIGGMAGVLSRAQRELGHNARSVCMPTGRFDFEADYILRASTTRGRAIEALRQVLVNRPGFDCFHFYFGYSLTGENLWDLPWLRRLGKRVFMYFCGCDIRDSKHVAAHYATSACRTCWPMYCSSNRAKAREVSLRYANGIFVSTPDLLEFLPGARLLCAPVDLALLGRLTEGPQFAPPPGIPGVDRPVRIAHAPSNRSIKGTQHLEAAVERLQQQGLPLELVLIEKMSHTAALAACASCDIAVDQLLIGAYGQFAVEMMALGKPTICYIREDLIAHYPQPCPVISASPDTIDNVLAAWATQPQLWPECSSAGRAYVADVHDHRVVARRTWKPTRRLQIEMTSGVQGNCRCAC